MTRFGNRIAVLAPLICVIGGVLATGCQTPERGVPVGRIEHEGIVAGFSERSSAAGEPVYFEPSALIRDGTNVLIANDKPIPGLSPILTVPLAAFTSDYVGSGAVSYLKSPVLEASSKIESFAASEQWSFAASGFDRINVDSPENDSFNDLVAWPVGQPQDARVICASERDHVVSSRGLRASFVEALKSRQFPDGPPYFKIEGLAAPDPQTLIFGVREMGRSFRDHEYCFRLVRASVAPDAGAGVALARQLEQVLNFKPSVPGQPQFQLGLSSLEFDPELQVFIALTSYERGENIGAFLWVFSVAELAQRLPPRLVRQDNGKPLLLAHKGEGLVALGAGRYLVICDDDDVITPVRSPQGVRARRPNEAVFYVIAVHR